MESVTLDEIYKTYYHLELCYQSKKNIGSPSGSQIFSIEKKKKKKQIAMRCQEQIRRCLGNPTESSRRRSNRHQNKVRITRIKHKKSRSEVRFSKIPRGISDLSMTNRICLWSFRHCTTAVAIAPDHNHRRCTKSPLLLLLLLPSLCSRLSLPHSKPSSLSHFLFLRFLASYNSS
ncbi:hypothetical protein NE237_002663 [Protea cynaroides]|uniref:Uncharacterized protein n=1 Tax=Protea cynaroides TaxID=273540 RepID=A0A9Q0GN40_9MAGN|nr:hypothetical protein NE237_002663 [Protea cynaroides]